MEEKKNEIDTLIPRKILVPIEDKTELTRPSMSMKSNNLHSRTEQLRKFEQE